DLLVCLCTLKYRRLLVSSVAPDYSNSSHWPPFCRQWLERRCFRGVDGGILRSLLRQGTRTRRRPPVERRPFGSSGAPPRAWKQSSRCAIRIRLAEKLKDRRRCA